MNNQKAIYLKSVFKGFKSDEKVGKLIKDFIISAKEVRQATRKTGLRIQATVGFHTNMQIRKVQEFHSIISD